MPDLIVLDDADFGFRDYPELWPKSLEDPSKKPWILIKSAVPLRTTVKDQKKGNVDALS